MGVDQHEGGLAGEAYHFGPQLPGSLRRHERVDHQGPVTQVDDRRVAHRRSGDVGHRGVDPRGEFDQVEEGGHCGQR